MTKPETSKKSKSKNRQLVALGEQIRKHRVKQGYSQEEFSLLVGLDRTYYGGIERGERNVSALNLILIAAALELEVGDLFPSMNILRS